MSDDARQIPQSDLDCRRRTGARMIALGHALRCKLGEADDRSMTWAVNTVLQTHADTDPLAVQVRDMSRRWRELSARHQVDQLKAAGEQLLRAVERASWPSQSDRPDLDG
ncbi:hypothetical protein [Paracoccus aeridis]|uniref:hypothetical protein n=1 Tax=Paracoccus aeridis TaxID=1966466 RepID=UPI0010AABCAC|nr:hypothetical protein [Paracoccus aeridis]